MARTKFLLLGLILVLAMCAVIRPISAPDGVSISNSGNIEVVAGQSNHNSIQFSDPSGIVITDVTINCVGLPLGATCSTNPPSLPGPFGDGYTFEVVISTSPSTPPGTYPITVTVSFTETITTEDELIQPPILILSGGSLGPSSVSIQQSFSPSTQFNLIVDPAPPIPEYPLGLPILAIFMVIGYGVIKRRTIRKQK